MSVASHLQIPLEEYDARIRTFIPGYEHMVEAAAAALRALTGSGPTIVDLGIGSGALAAACLDVHPGATLVGIDADPAILEQARRRLAGRCPSASFLHGDFQERAIPPADAIVASLALHHVKTADGKQRFYRACRSALRRGGLLVSADCFPSSDARLAALEREAWRAHLRRTYSDAETDGYFAAWADEDEYMPLARELVLLGDAGFTADVTWRVAPFGVIVGAAD